MNATIVDDKSEHCIPFLLKLLEAHRLKYGNSPTAPPFFVSTLRSTLSTTPYNLPTITFSLDDIYLTHDDQRHLAATHPSNPLLQHRGQPSTHDIPLGSKVFDSLRRNEPTKIPSYDKSAFNGQGDRAPEDTWEIVNDTQNGQPLIKVVIFEGWCVGFRSRPESEIQAEWENAVRRREQDDTYNGQLGHVKLEDVMTINDSLKKYDAFNSDAEDTHNVYYWRQQQEQTLLATKGKGMTSDQVTKFVNGYYPSYELYTNQLRKGVFRPVEEKGDEGWKGRQLRLIVDKQRRVKEVLTI
ncbi:hypothetical protein TRV_00993 [Trichophyton verrucosum HKI 0517]|uniref:Uncharacterized protein n=1 Tax=Trichophyton verrucosum (strain HKI 0517) TaxID=663202 RepID=D4D1Q0_TRIVH|nr:uncharacterized protein TRV_00993 [Trichophyton verrucosum HKI 0517]EFE44217.1 hypothetical protein TRV_00993 [Trichophyton verrucosum HKI 0517]